MGRIPPEDLEAVRARIPITDVISEHVALKGSGTSMKGLCPFHQERTPSFNVNATTNTFHCLAGETLVKTPDGDVPIQDLAGTTATVLDGDGIWTEAPIREFGTQSLMKVTLSRNGTRRVIYATSDHRWYVRPRHSNDAALQVVTTKDLVPRLRIPSVWPRRRVGSAPLSPVGAMAGFVFGDGYATAHGSIAYFHGDKDADMVHLFQDAGLPITQRDAQRRACSQGLPRSWKKNVPDLTEGTSYLYGWLAGLFAADGCVSSDGRATLSASSAATVRFVTRLCDKLGIGIMATYTQSRLGLGKTPSDLHHISFRGRSLTPDFFLLDAHRERFSRAKERQTYERTNWWVVSVEETARHETVYCATVPTTDSFVLADNILTGNCFGCDESGDVIDFIQQIEGEGFRWAVTFLADKFNIPISFDAEDEDADKPKRSRLIEAHQIAERAYAHALLNDPEGQLARDLLTQRGFDVTEATERFGCGYAPTTRSISQLLTTKGFTQEEIIESGLANLYRGNLEDRFHGRLLWTIRNSFGKPIGFGARKLRDSDRTPGKFINTSETPIYKKSEVLFGLDLARKEIARTRQAIVVEGYTDVMAMHLAGQTNVIASCGTAFGSHHMHTLRRLVGEAGEVVFAFDDDDAGQKAAQSAYRDFNSSLRRLSALPSSDGMDPDQVRQSKGDEGLRDLVARRETLSAAVIRMVLGQMPQETPEDRIAALDAALPYLNDIADPLVRHEYAAKVAQELRFNAVQVEGRITPSERSAESPGETTQAPLKPEWVEKEVLRVFAQSEEIAREYLSDWEIDLKFHQAVSYSAIDALRKGLSVPREGGLAWPLHLKATSEGDDARLVSTLTASALPIAVDDARPYVDELLARLDRQSDKRTVQELKEKIARADTPDGRAAALQQLMAHQRQSRGA